jgi:hypothetical protein
MTALARPARLALLALLAWTGVGCATAGGRTAIRVVATPVTVVRDVVDAPVFTITNTFEYFARHTAPAKAPGAGVGWNWKGGFNFGIGYDVSHFLFKGLSGIFGAVDYVACRSVYPNFPKGVSPWTKRGERWWGYYFPNTRALWSPWEGWEEVHDPPLE